MANEYETRANLKLALKITEVTRDVLLDKALSAASRGIDRETGRRFWLDPTPTVRVYRTTGRVVGTTDGELLIVSDIGDSAGLVVETGTVAAGWTTVTDYETQPDNAIADGKPITGLLRINGCWPRGTTRVRVTTRHGWPAFPDEVVEATRIQSGRLYNRPGSLEGVAGNAEWGAVRVVRVDPDVRALISHLMLPGF